MGFVDLIPRIYFPFSWNEHAIQSYYLVLLPSLQSSREYNNSPGPLLKSSV